MSSTSLYKEDVFPEDEDLGALPSFPQQPLNLAGPETTAPGWAAGEANDRSQQDASFANMFADFGGKFDELIGTASAYLNEDQRAVDATLGTAGYAVIRRSYKSGLVTGCIGQGSFGLVYRCTKQGSQSHYAVKAIARGQNMGTMLDLEINLLKSLHHPGIVNYVETINASSGGPNKLYIVMEFCQGGDLLGRMITQPHHFTENLTRALLFHMSIALAYAHQQGVVHRDMKPENVLLTEQGFPKIADFGLARRLADEGNCQTVAGTPAYWAPEIRAKSSYEFAVDTYAVGLILQDMMAKKYCVEWMVNDQCPAAMRSKLQKIPQPGKPDHTGFTYHPRLIQLRQSMTDKNPKNRPTLYAVVQYLIKLGSEDKKPHRFWGPPYSVNTIMPRGPPHSAPSEGVKVAAKYGLAEGVKLRIKVGETWLPGTITHIDQSDTIAPGSVTVKFTDKSNRERETVVTPPAFTQVLTLNTTSPKPKPLGGMTKNFSGKTVGQPGQKPCCCIVQ
jgi:serine/threonine protein kinase